MSFEVSKVWQNFFERMNAYQNLPLADWKEIHLLGYLCQKYENLYGQKFVFNMHGAPTKCTELVLMKQMCSMFQTKNPFKLKAFIDWCFEQKIAPRQLKIKTLAFFRTPGLGNEFNFVWKNQTEINKNTPLPPEYQAIVNKHTLSLSTYGDLIFVRAALQQDSESESRRPYKDLMIELAQLGFDSTLLDKIK